MACIQRTLKFLKFSTIFAFACAVYVVTTAQSDTMISATYIDQFQSVQQIDYVDFDIDINIGWFVANPTATEFIIFDNDQTLHRILNNEIVESWQYITSPDQLFLVIDGVYFNDMFYILHTVDDTFWINDTQLVIEGFPLALGNDDNHLYVEAQVENELIVYQFNADLEITGDMMIPSDDDAPVIRVGRIDLPIILQTTFDGQVTAFVFDEEFGTYDVGELPTVFGHVNASTSHFTWSDPNSTDLNLLNLLTGENQVVSSLDNLYAQYYLLTHDASLVIAINVDFEPNMVAWDTETGERYVLGQYRACERIPDRVKLSADGTTLIVGCDTGLELWKIADETESD